MENSFMSEDVSSIAEALSKFQGEVKSIIKEATGYGYKYTPLHVMLDYALPLTSKFGLSITQLELPDGNLMTLLLHNSGQWIKSTSSIPSSDQLEMKGVNLAQKRGALLSYFRRYAVGAILGLASNDEDIDASSEGPKLSKQETPKELPKANPSTSFRSQSKTGF
jgi:hypothetical protein